MPVCFGWGPWGMQGWGMRLAAGHPQGHQGTGGLGLARWSPRMLGGSRYQLELQSKGHSIRAGTRWPQGHPSAGTAPAYVAIGAEGRRQPPGALPGRGPSALETPNLDKPCNLRGVGTRSRRSTSALWGRKVGAPASLPRSIPGAGWGLPTEQDYRSETRHGPSQDRPFPRLKDWTVWSQDA